MITAFTEFLVAMGRGLLDLAGNSDPIPAWTDILLASLLGSFFATSVLVGCYLVGNRIAARAAAAGGESWRWTTAAALVRSLRPLLALAGILVAASPIFTRLGPLQASVIVWVSLGAGLAFTARSALVAVDAGAARLRSLSLGTERSWDDLLVELGAQVARTAVVVGALYLATIILIVPERAHGTVGSLFGLALIALIAWMFVSLVRIGDRFLQHRFRIDVPDNLEARRVYTQLMVMRRLAYLLIGVLAVALALMQFEGIRRIGTSILASAGLAGVILGFAAQRTLANLLAGIQIALTQPLRIDDVVMMEGECGRIEEVTLTYVVVAIWDQRRLIVPLSRVIENPFQNWTRTGSRLLGTVTMRCDFRVPVEAMRAEAKRLVEADARWDRQAFAFQVTDCAERTVEVRVLLSANDSGALFDLRCAVREALLRWLMEADPTALPRVRLEAEPRVAENAAPGLKALEAAPALLHQQAAG